MPYLAIFYILWVFFIMQDFLLRDCYIVYFMTSEGIFGITLSTASTAIGGIYFIWFF